jgi:hypothetical protein
VFKLDNKLGLGLAALGRPGYITLAIIKILVMINQKII